MKITVSQLRRIIREEVSRVVHQENLNEGFLDMFKGKKGVDMMKVRNETMAAVSKYTGNQYLIDDLTEVGTYNADSNEEYLENVLPYFVKAVRIAREVIDDNKIPKTNSSMFAGDEGILADLTMFALEKFGLEGANQSGQGHVSQQWWKKAKQAVADAIPHASFSRKK